MQLKTILNRVEHNKSFVYRTDRLVEDADGRLTIEVTSEPRANGRPLCSGCQRARRPENLTDRQTVKLSELLKYNLQSVRGYLLREDFQRFWEYRSPTWAKKFLDEWCRRAMRSQIAPLKKVVRTLRKHQDLLVPVRISKVSVDFGSGDKKSSSKMTPFWFWCVSKRRVITRTGHHLRGENGCARRFRGSGGWIVVVWPRCS
jgi:hypothetical protein